MNPYKIIKQPVITERATFLREQDNKYVFIVEKKATKSQIKNALKELFNVEAEKINTMTVKGKLKRLGRYEGYRPDTKKAIVKLKQGQEIKLIEESR